MHAQSIHPMTLGPRLGARAAADPESTIAPDARRQFASAMLSMRIVP